MWSINASATKKGTQMCFTKAVGMQSSLYHKEHATQLVAKLSKSECTTEIKHP